MQIYYHFIVLGTGPDIYLPLLVVAGRILSQERNMDMIAPPYRERCQRVTGDS
jgi:hypothetical protein